MGGVTHFDLAIIGSGSGNSIPDDRFSEHRIAILEKGTFGGTCLNVGCIPTKMFVHPADLAASVSHARELGVDHALVGGVLARRWNLPKSVASAIERHHAEDAQVEPVPADEQPAYRGVTLAINLPTEDAVDLAFVRVREVGGTIVKPPTRAEWGGYSGYFADPDGILWEVAYNPGFPIDEHGRIEIA